MGACRTRSRRRGVGAAAPVPASARAPPGRVRTRSRRVERRSLPGRLPAREPGPSRVPHCRPPRRYAGPGAMELTAVDVRAWLAEDIGDGDRTGDPVVDADA